MEAHEAWYDGLNALFGATVAILLQALLPKNISGKLDPSPSGEGEMPIPATSCPAVGERI